MSDAARKREEARQKRVALARREFGRQQLDWLWQGENILLAPAVLAVAVTAAEMTDPDLPASVRTLARAVGVDGRREALYGLAATALKLAAQLDESEVPEIKAPPASTQRNRRTEVARRRRAVLAWLRTRGGKGTIREASQEIPLPLSQADATMKRLSGMKKVRMLDGDVATVSLDVTWELL